MPEEAPFERRRRLEEGGGVSDQHESVDTQAGGPRRRRLRARWLVAAAGIVAVLVVGLGLAVARPWSQEATCEPIAENPDWSVARRWDEALLDAIRRALPAPTEHARNLYHSSAAMWDAWAAYDDTAQGVFVTEKVRVLPWERERARETAMSYAAYGVLSERYIDRVGGADSLSQFADLMDALCLPLDDTSTEGGSPAALGNRIAAAVIAAGLADGSNEAGGYAAEDYQPVNEPLTVASDTITLADPNRWQPLQIEHMISQNGIPVTNGVQQAIGPEWGYVDGFALPAEFANGTPIDPGPPPRLGDPVTDRAYKDQAVEVVRLSSQLDPAQAVTIDISPGTMGNNPLGTDDGTGYDANPVTGQPYAPELVNQADFARALAEFWADGPKSETPPGHWNVVANEVSDQLDPDLRIRGSGERVNRLEWDAKLYLALNGAVHDAAIAAWGLKGHYDSVRPISMIRYMASKGQSSDPALPSYDPHGIPLVPGLVELISAETTAPGERHEALQGHEGEIALYAWAGNPDDPKTQTGGVAWILGTTWLPFQLPTFVTPAFPAFVSGHSTFSRAAAEVLTGFTGSAAFPGGLGEFRVPADHLKFEKGPQADVVLQWATYFDAADQAGRSRLYGGIHISADDVEGRKIGSTCGKEAWTRAQQQFDGTITQTD
jgi:hypothetical protein